MNHSSVKHKTVMVNLITSHNNCGWLYCRPLLFMFDREVVHIAVAGYIVDNYCFMFNWGAIHIVVAKPLLCQTSNSNCEQYNSHNNMNHSSVKHETVSYIVDH
jgi:hypothetical protein